MTKILVTGASSGMGYQIATALVQQGYQVYGAARQVTKMPANVIPLYLDLTDEAAIEKMVTQMGPVDMVVNNAGYGAYGAIEDVTLAEARRQFDVNLFGLARLTQLVLPQMRVQGHGRIINIGSMGGRFTTYLGAWYHATKYALEAFTDALRMESKPFGIQVILIEPGGINTPWGQIAADHLVQSAQGGAYAQQAQKAAQQLAATYRSRWLSQPTVIANTVLKAVKRRHPRSRYLVGAGAKPLVLLHTLLPTRSFDWLMVHFT
jgi:NAD(P)-dependent dehydrogenase (short-subunit alcohol dehydrogenase family)